MLKSKKSLLERCDELGIKRSSGCSKEKLLELIQQKEKTTISVIPTDKEITHIYHLADIHIKYLDRHEEYRQVFQRLYDYIQNDACREKSIMVICGDLFHNRDRFVSETIVIFDTFIKKVTSLVETFMILGNHDCFNHGDRLDTISGISSIANYPNFHFLKKSGIYRFGKISFGVSSLIDGLGVPTPLATIDDIKIALHHGIVSGTTLDNGTKVSDGMSLDAFKDYDLVLLGDVHKRQYLNQTKTVAYPGSLIQQNFKEELVHGFLKWSLSTKSSQFIPIKNDYSFVDIPVNTTLDLSRINFTKYSRIRLLIDHKDLEQDINNTIMECEKHTTIVSIKKYMKEAVLEQNADGEDVIPAQDINTHELDIIKKMVKDESQLEKVVKLHQSFLNSVDDDEAFVHSLPWSIEKIEFRNIFSYGNDILNIIDLKDGVTGILADNASGKTNILNTIIYGLFGNGRAQNHLNKNIISRYAKKEDLMVKLTIKMSTGEVYYVERCAKTKTRSRIKSSEAGQVDLVETLKFYTDNEILNLGTKPETEKMMRNVLSMMGREEFVLTNMMSNISYGANMSIVSMTGAHLDEVFNNIFNLNKYKTLHTLAKTEAKKITDEIKTNSIKLEMINDNLKNYEINTLNREAEALEINEKILVDEISTLEKDINSVYTKLMEIKKISVNEDEETLNNRLVECREILEEYTEGSIDDLITQESKLQNEYEAYKKIYIKADTAFPRPNKVVEQTIEAIQNSIDFNLNSKKQVNFDADITNEYMRAKKFISSIQKESTLDIDMVKKSLVDLQFDAEREAYILPKKTRDLIIRDLTKSYVDPGLVLKYTKVIEDKETRDITVSENIKIDQLINKLKRDQKDRKIQDAYEIKEKLIKLSDLLEYISVYHEITEIMDDLQILKDNKDVNELLTTKDALAKNMDIARENLHIVQVTLATKKQDILRCKTLLKSKDKILPILDQHIQELEIYKTYTDITHPKNLPKTLISNVIKSISSEANRLIFNTTGLLVQIRENDKWEIEVKKDDLVLGPQHCSGFELFIMNTALKIAFDKYKQLSSIKLFLLDETVDCVSESNLDQIDVVLEYLQKHYNKVVLISHNEDLKKKIDSRINIKLDKKCSSIA
jgi:DNA repair exonuclease SbcCD ATPase subunit